MDNPTNNPPTRYAIAIYPGFSPLDVLGPLDILERLAKITKITIAIQSLTRDPISSALPAEVAARQRIDVDQSHHAVTLQPSDTFHEPPDDGIEVLIVPGGLGALDERHTGGLCGFIDAAMPTLKSLMTVSNGGIIAARSGSLDGKMATIDAKSLPFVS